MPAASVRASPPALRGRGRGRAAGGGLPAALGRGVPALRRIADPDRPPPPLRPGDGWKGCSDGAGGRSAARCAGLSGLRGRSRAGGASRHRHPAAAGRAAGGSGAPAEGGSQGRSRAAPPAAPRTARRRGGGRAPRDPGLRLLVGPAAGADRFRLWADGRRSRIELAGDGGPGAPRLRRRIPGGPGAGDRAAGDREPVRSGDADPGGLPVALGLPGAGARRAGALGHDGRGAPGARLVALCPAPRQLRERPVGRLLRVERSRAVGPAQPAPRGLAAAPRPRAHLPGAAPGRSRARRPAADPGRGAHARPGGGPGRPRGARRPRRGRTRFPVAPDRGAGGARLAHPRALRLDPAPPRGGAGRVRPLGPGGDPPEPARFRAGLEAPRGRVGLRDRGRRCGAAPGRSGGRGAEPRAPRLARRGAGAGRLSRLAAGGPRRTRPPAGRSLRAGGHPGGGGRRLVPPGLVDPVVPLDRRPATRRSRAARGCGRELSGDPGSPPAAARPRCARRRPSRRRGSILRFPICCGSPLPGRSSA